MATATRPQINYLTTLVEARLVPAWVEDFLTSLNEGPATREASRAIDEAKASPYRPCKVAMPSSVEKGELVPVGFYFMDGDVYKVKPSKNDPTLTRRYAYKFVTDGTTKGHYEYTKGAIYRLSPAHKLTIEQAAKIGHMTGVCCCCGKELSDPESVKLGAGPICIKKYM